MLSSDVICGFAIDEHISNNKHLNNWRNLAVQMKRKLSWVQSFIIGSRLFNWLKTRTLYHRHDTVLSHAATVSKCDLYARVFLI